MIEVLLVLITIWIWVIAFLIAGLSERKDRGNGKQ
jgi:hypothetical protein